MIYVADVKITQDYMKRRNNMKEKCYTVWVGGTEVNDYYLDRDSALRLAQLYIDDGYDDVNIEESKEKEINNGDKKLNNIY
jgi:hypothetical protein